MPEAAFTGLREALERLHADEGFTGTVLVTAAAEPVFEAHLGAADRAAGVPISSRTRFGLGSVTKMFTAVAVLRLATAGALALDDRVADLLPPERRPSTLRGDVRVRHLLTHTSGIADYFEEETVGEDWAAEYAALWADLPLYRVRTPADYLPLFADLPPYRAPGGEFQYSNAGYLLLGLVIEAVTGRGYHAAVDAEVFGPAGMGDSGFFAFDEVRPDLAVGYLPPRAEGEPWRTNVYAMPCVGGADGGAYATAADLDRFLTAYAQGGLLEPAMLAEALRPHARVDEDTAMGYGVYLFDEGRAFGHDGGDPGAEAVVVRFPELGVNTVVLSNVNACTMKVNTAVRRAVTGGR